MNHEPLFHQSPQYIDLSSVYWILGLDNLTDKFKVSLDLNNSFEENYLFFRNCNSGGQTDGRGANKESTGAIAAG